MKKREKPQPLHNSYDKETLLAKLQAENFERTTLSFYQYAHINEPQEFRDILFKNFAQLNIFGRVYVAREGINAQISVPQPRFAEFQAYLNTIPFLQNIRLNYAIEDDGESFYKLKIKVRPKIVADGLNDATFDVTQRGQHLSAEAFNELTEKPETLVVDMRNHYESEVGHFENAICPDVDTFRDALPLVEELLQNNKEQPIIMYCTGGIRCEKASAWYKHRGFKQVYQLDGGIIEYAREVEKKGLPNKFKGKNFVFDKRMGERIGEEVISKCHQCGKPCDVHTNCANDACHLLFIQCPECAEAYQGCCTIECREFIALPEEKQKELRKGKIMPFTQRYQKGRTQNRLRPKLTQQAKPQN